MSTKPHLSQIQSTDKEKHQNLFSELVEIIDKIALLEGKGVKDIFNSYEDMVAGASEVGFYNVIIDETFKNQSTGYYYDGSDFRIKYGLKSIVDDIEDIVDRVDKVEDVTDNTTDRVDKIEDITNDVVDLILPKLDEDKLGDVVLKPGQTIIEIPLDKEEYDYVGGILVDGAVVGDIRIEGDKLVIVVDPLNPSTEVKVTIPEGSLESSTGKVNKPIEVEFIVQGAKPIIEQNDVNGNMSLDLVGEHGFRFKINYPTPPIIGTVDLSLIHCTQGLVSKELDTATDTLVIKLNLTNGREYKVIFYKGVVDSDDTLSDYLECRFKVKDIEVDPDPEEPDPSSEEFIFTLPNAVSMFDFNGVYPIPGDLDIYGSDYTLYYLGYSGNDKPILVPRTGFDTFVASNPDGGYSYMSGVFFFETASIGTKVYKLVKI